jgi:hypothetical protein
MCAWWLDHSRSWTPLDLGVRIFSRQRTKSRIENQVPMVAHCMDMAAHPNFRAREFFLRVNPGGDGRKAASRQARIAFALLML